jgi:hypothetical protein
VVHALAVLGRRALHAENSPWSTLFALLFRDAFFLPLPGVLPVRGLGGPLDLGSPSFYARRRSLIEERLARVAAGGGPSLLAERDALHRGEALAGADWSLPAPILREIVEALPGPVLAEVLGRLAREGHTARRGMPDLVVLPGPTTRWEGAFPERLPEALFLAEVKGPGDAVRDDQSLWFDRLLGAGLRVELWQAARET